MSPDALAQLPGNLWQRLEQVGSPVRLEPGELLWTPGEQQLGQTYFLTSGLMRLYHLNHGGDAVTILAVGAGGMLGHHPSLEDSPYDTGAEAILPSSLLSVPSAILTEWLTAHDTLAEEFAGWILEDLNRHLMNTYARLELEHSSARERVARTLVTLDAKVLLPRVSRQQLADLCNLTTETVVRTLSGFLKDGTLESTRFIALSADERHALVELLEPYEPDASPYS